MKSARGLLSLTRPGNVLIAAGAVVTGVLAAPSLPPDWGPVVWAAVAASLVTAGGNVLNDVVDVRVDRMSKPHRAVASGLVSIPLAILWSLMFFTGAVIASVPLPTLCEVITVGAVVLVVVYDLWGKGQPLVGNVMVSAISGMAFPFASLAAGLGWWGAIPGVLALLFHLGREIIKDLEDEYADRQASLRTLPVAAGSRAARGTAGAVLTLLLVSLPVPWIAGWMGPAYLVLAGVGVGLPVLGVLYVLVSGTDRAGWGRAARVLKWDMLAGLLAVIVG
ncbi:MAG: geranylgeranylglycerol-phosphate geranylgeranyltransferase [bacterium]